MMRIDFNCDLGEGCGNDAGIIPLISSASIACGGHAGDARTMDEAIGLCLRHGVAIGAHPSFEDREHFGRRELATTPDAVHDLVARQLAVLAAACDRHATRPRHVKPHGALYNLAARDAAIAQAIVDAVLAQDPSLVLYALSGSVLARAGETAGLRVAHEVFAERRYEADGTLTPRDRPDAVIEGIADALAQVEAMLATGRVTARTGETVAIQADTLCLHGDRADAPDFARALHDTLAAAGVRIVAPGAS
ncbi:5-oxoprolinase subunit PxpA [Luteimonas vadosa]|uniref:5-oxoprolinase subunit PxpA n=1 Tax=Luteimonas vadosa TaxID=1165507 RepID=A0ABP9DZR5_9GAMM